MASIVNEGNGRRMIEFILPNGTRGRIRLGQMNRDNATKFKARLLDLLASKRSGGKLDDETQTWLTGMDDKTHKRLVRLGLAATRQPVATTAPVEVIRLGQFIAGYIAKRTDVKPNTLMNLRRAETELLAFFKADKPLADITPAAAQDYARQLTTPKDKDGRGMSINTARRLCGRAKQLFRYACLDRLIADNPFTGIDSRVKCNKARQFFITRAMADTVIAACPDAQWRLIFALSRYGGLRCPSETLSLKWGDIDFDRGRIRVPSPKTERYEGQEERIIPLFPELREPLMDAFTQAEPGTNFVITRYRGPNLRTGFERIVAKAGLTPWPKLFHNLRSSRATELAQTHPAHVVCAWLGNTEAVAEEHYLQVTEADFEKAAHFPGQHTTAQVGNAQKSAKPNTQNPTEIPTHAELCESVPTETMPPVGIEPTRPFEVNGF